MTSKDRLREARKYRDFAVKEQMTNRISAVLTEAAPMLQVDVERLDSDPYLLNCPDGTVDLRTGKMREHSANDFLTKQTACSPTATPEQARVWADFLSQITCGDDEYTRYLQKICGLFLIGEVKLEKLFVAVGSGGNGKSTLFNTLLYVLGSYGGTISPDVLTITNRNTMPEYAELRGKRLVIAPETDENQRFDSTAIKRLSSTDLIRAERKYCAPFSFRPTHSLVMFTNTLPKLGAVDAGTWDRIVILPFTARFRGTTGERFNYAETLFHSAGGAVLTWMIDGARQVIESGFRIDEPECVRVATRQYREDSDWLANFVDERCERGTGYTAGSSELYSEYQAFSRKHGTVAISTTAFRQAVQSAGYTYRHTKTGTKVSGLRVKSTAYPKLVDQNAAG